MSDSSGSLGIDKEEQGKNSQHLSPETAHEEGVRGWLCVVGSFICIFCTFGFLSAMGLFQTTYKQTILSDYSTSDITWIFAIQLALMWIPGPLFGRLIDTYGPAPVLYPCAVLCVFGLAMTSLAEEYYQIFLAQGLAFGIGSGGVFTTALVCVAQWFERRRGLATGIASVGSSLGGVIFPIFFVRVSEKVGFHGAVRYSTLLIGVLLAASSFMVRARLPRRKWDPNSKWVDLTLFKQKQFSLYAAGSFFVMWGLWGPLNFISSMALNAGFPPTLAIYLISIVNAGMVPGRILPPYIGDRIGHFNVITLCCLLTSLSILALWLPFNYYPSQAGIIVFAIVYGCASGAFVSLLMPCAAKAGSLETLGQRFGTFQMVLGLSCLTGLPIIGSILSSQNNTDYMGVQLWSGLCCLLGTGLLAVSTYLLSKIQKTRKV
ncbi:major facilitator superfamily domain-containing protein [Biscogniauxia marginata]|nr:major facilitator superfamily domain-containing protein [Biscogniauxia marginata]